MIDSKLTFRVQEIEEGRSRRDVELNSEDLGLEEMDDLKLKHARAGIDFHKTDHFVEVDFNVEASLELVCDRSLKPFEHRIRSSYKVLFKPSVEAPSEDEESKVKQIGRDLSLGIDQEVRDTILLGLPSRKLHPDYLDESGHPTKFEPKVFGGPEQKDEPETDPRWEKLKNLKRES